MRISPCAQIFAAASLAYLHDRANLSDTIKRLETLKLDWRYDSFEQELLRYLGPLYIKNKQYGAALRNWKELLGVYPNIPDALEITIAMNDLFVKLYNEGLADALSPLKSLALFYEFRHLIPVDERGDSIVRKLADRLMQVDLNPRAIALLAHQVKFRSQGVERAELGARLAFLHLIENNADKALTALEATNYGSLPGEIATLRNQLTARALAKSGDNEQAFATLRIDTTNKGAQLRLEIVWDAQDWPNVINIAEDQLALREDFTAPLNKAEQALLLKLALAYSYEDNADQLKYLRDYYMNNIPKDSNNRQVFDYLTSNTQALNIKDISVIAKQISSTTSFLKSVRESFTQDAQTENDSPAKPE